MKKLLFLLLSILLLSGCEKKTLSHEYLTVEAQDNLIVIPTSKVSETATYVNYDLEGVTIQFILVRGTDGEIHFALNTCQSCNPSPDAYFVQEGEYFICQNCKNRFHVNEVGKTKGGCNPTPITYEEKEDTIELKLSDVEKLKSMFENWNGPTKNSISL